MIPDILIVEDNAADITLLRRAIKKVSPSSLIVTIMGGARAWDYLQTVSPKAVVLDLILPGMDGMEILKKMRKDPNLVNTPVVILTGVWEEDIENECRVLGVMTYVKKPDQRYLSDVVRQIVLHAIRGTLNQSMAIMSGLRGK